MVDNRGDLAGTQLKETGKQKRIGIQQLGSCWISKL